MLWRNRRESGNILDQRRISGKALGGGGLLIGAILYALMGGNPLEYIAVNSDREQAGSVARSRPGQGQNPSAGPGANNGVNDDAKRFVAVVLADTEDVWHAVFRESGLAYREPKLVLFSRSIRSACGRASSAVGPFYCPADERVYLDLDFLTQLQRTLGAQGDFAQAYVIAHEVGHHVQNQLGISRQSVQAELQADCLAGVWAQQTQRTKNVIESGDLEEAIGAAEAVGDDRIQMATRGEVVPDSFTHGSSEQRARAFRLGLTDGDPQACLDGYR